MTETNPTEAGSVAERFEETHKHLMAGYGNAQETIRFIDTKTGVMTGLLTATTGAPLLFFEWVIGLDEKSAVNYKRFAAIHPIPTEVIILGMVVGMSLGIVGILVGVDGLMARSPRKFYQGIFGPLRRLRDKHRGQYKKKTDRPPVTILFPIYQPDEEDYAQNYFQKAVKGLAEREILEEYSIQMPQVGRILSRKITCNQWSVRFFSLQIIVYALTGLASFCAVKFFWY